MSTETHNLVKPILLGVVLGSLIGGMGLGVIGLLSSSSPDPATPDPTELATQQEVAAPLPESEPAPPPAPEPQEEASNTANDQPAPSTPKVFANTPPPASGDASVERVESVRKKLRLIALAMLNYESSRRGFPQQSLGGGLSWRVAILPYLEQGPLYKRFKHDEPWDSPTNSALLPLMPEIYRSIDSADPITHFVRFVGDHTMCPPTDRPMSYRRCTDGTANTVLVAHAGGAVPWTKPQDLPFDPTTPHNGLAPLADRIEMVLVDGSLLAVQSAIAAETLKALITANGGEVVDGHGVQRQQNFKADGSAASMADSRRASQERLNQTVRALHDYHDSRNSLPSPWMPGRKNERGERPAVSWRVMLLPYLDQQALYKTYNLAEPWDSEANLRLIRQIPSVYQHDANLASGETRVHMLAGPGAAMQKPVQGKKTSRISFRKFRGASMGSVILVEAGPETAAPWTQPAALDFDPQQPLETLGTLPADGFPAAMLDGSVHWLAPDITAEQFKSQVLIDKGAKP